MESTSVLESEGTLIGLPTAAQIFRMSALMCVGLYPSVKLIDQCIGYYSRIIGARHLYVEIHPITKDSPILRIQQG